MANILKQKPSELLRKKLGKLEFSTTFKSGPKVSYGKFLEIAKKAALTFKENGSNSRPGISL